MDFGIAKTEGLSLTRTGFVLGTPYYMAPEQVLGKNVTDQVDVYAFGVLLFELLTGDKPVSGDTVERIFYSILNEPLNLEPLRQAGTRRTASRAGGGAARPRTRRRARRGSPRCARNWRDLLKAVGSRRRAQPAPPARGGVDASLAAAGRYRRGLGAGGRGARGSRRVRPAPARAKLPPRISTPTGEMVLVPAGPFLFGEKKEPVIAAGVLHRSRPK